MQHFPSLQQKTSQSKWIKNKSDSETMPPMNFGELLIHRALYPPKKHFNKFFRLTLDFSRFVFIFAFIDL